LIGEIVRLEPYSEIMRVSRKSRVKNKRGDTFNLVGGATQIQIFGRL
jgi:hypothetical protein